MRSPQTQQANCDQSGFHNDETQNRIKVDSTMTIYTKSKQSGFHNDYIYKNRSEFRGDIPIN